MRIIDADALVTIQMFDPEHEEWYTERITIAECLDSYADEGCPPTIDAVEVKHGEWIGYNADKGIDWLRSDGEPIFLVCNKCHGIVMNNASVNWNFCPNCGAKMGTACTHVEEASDE